MRPAAAKLGVELSSWHDTGAQPYPDLDAAVAGTICAAVSQHLKDTAKKKLENRMHAIDCTSKPGVSLMR